MERAHALPKELTIYTVGEFRTELLAGETGGEEVMVMDGAGVEVVDCAGLQLLIALSNSQRARGRGLRIAGASASLRDACRILGLGDLLEVAGAQGVTA